MAGVINWGRRLGVMLALGLVLATGCGGLGIEGEEGRISVTFGGSESGAAATAAPAATNTPEPTRPAATATAAAPTAVPQREGICGRTAAVAEWIQEAMIWGIGDCARVTGVYLDDLRGPMVIDGRVKPGDFRGLSGVKEVTLRDCAGELRDAGYMAGVLEGLDRQARITVNAGIVDLGRDEHFQRGWAALQGESGQFSRHETGIGLSAEEAAGIAAAEAAWAEAEEWAKSIVAAIQLARMGRTEVMEREARDGGWQDGGMAVVVDTGRERAVVTSYFEDYAPEGWECGEAAGGEG